MSWEEEARGWIAWARTPGHDAYWEYSPRFFELVPPAGRATLELGCGEGRVARDLQDRGHRVTGVDSSPTLLDAASSADPDGEYVVADAASLPFSDATFDLVVAYNSLMDIDDMPGAVREAARVLRPGGLLAFCATHPLVYLTWNDAKERQTRKLQIDYTELGRMDTGEGTVDWAVPPSRWIQLLREHGFDIEDLLELSPPEGATTTYDQFVPYPWARHWPAEEIWRARKR